MDTVSPFSNSGGPRILAHRGASVRERENTVAAFRLATDLGADGVELDVRRTADGVLVVHHDPAIEDVGRIPLVSMADIRRSAPWVPTFEEALDACTGVVNVEIKNSPAEPDHDPDDGVAQSVAPVLLGLIERGSALEFVVSSFNPRTIARVREVAPSLATGWLTMPGLDPLDALAVVVTQGHRALHPPIWSLTGAGAAAPGDAAGLDGALLDELIGAAHGAGIAVTVWTVDDPAAMLALAQAGVDAIITNVPDIAVSTLRP